jgi:hypothetical protein
MKVLEQGWVRELLLRARILNMSEAVRAKVS